MKIQEYIKTRSAKLVQSLARLVPDAKVPQAKLFQAARYSLLGEGKKLAPSC